MGKLVLECTSDLERRIPDAIHEGRVVLFGKTQRKRIIRRGVNDGLYIKMNKKKHYLSQGGFFVLTNGIREVPDNERR